MLLWSPDVTAGSAGGVGIFFMSSRWGMTSSVSGGPMERISNERYQEKAALRQASYARKKASATQEKGLIIVHTGRVIFDELNIVLRYDYLPLEEVLEELRSKREMLHVVITGRNAKEELMDMADLVTEMRLIKHPYKAGIKAQRGVEF